MDEKELLKKELREALMDPELYKKFRVTRDRPVRTSHSQSSRGIKQCNPDVKKTIKCMQTKADAAEDTEEQDFAMQQNCSSRVTATTVVPAIDREIGPLLLNEYISNNTKILKPKPTAPLKRKIQIVPIGSVHKSCKNPNFVFRPISPAGRPQEAQGASPEGGLPTFKDLMDQNEHKAYERENRVTAGNCNIYKQILAAAKENRKSSLKMSTGGDVEYPCNLDKSNVHHSLQKSIPNYSEEKLRKVWMHIANSNLDESPLDTQVEDIEQQSKTIGILPSLSTEGKFDADRFASVSKEAFVHDLVQNSSVLSEHSNTVSDAIPNKDGDDVKEDKELLPSISAEDKFDADQFASVSKEASAHDLVQPSAVLSEHSNTASDPIPNNHGDDITEDKQLLSSISSEDKIDADQFASVSKEASALDLVQPSAALSEHSNTASDPIPNNHGDDITEDKQLLSSISSEVKIDADQFASVSKEASALDLEQPSAVLSESSNTLSVAILNNHGDDNTTPKQEIPRGSSHATGTIDNTDRCLDVPKEASAHKLYQSSTILSKVFPNNHGDSTKQDQEIPSCLSTVDTCDAVRYVDVPTQASANNVDQSQTVERESAEATHDDIHNHSHNTKQDQDIPSGHPTLAKHGAAYAHDLGRPSAIVGETSVIFDDTPDMYSNACPDNEAMKSDQAKSVQYESIANVIGSSGCNQSSGLINNPFKLRNEDGDETNISEGSSSSDEDDMLNEVYQSCLAKGMRPKYLSSNYLKGLANARKTAAEIKARKPEPRVKLDKPCRLDTNLTYAVRQSLKRSLPLIAGKNKLSALMMMADGMFDEMSLDRDLDDLAWPFDPLAELRESGLWMVDYMDPHPTGSTKPSVKLQSTAMLSESNRTNVDDVQNNQGDAVSQEEEIPYDYSQETVTTHDSGRCVEVLSESSAHKLDECTGMLSGSNKTNFDDIQNNHGDASYQEQEIPSDNSQETLSTYDHTARCVDVSSESSAHKLDQCTDMLSESNKTIFDDIQTDHAYATYQEQEIPSDNSQETSSTYDAERCVDVSSESSAHKLDQCKGMLSESNKTIFEDIQINHDDASYQEQEIPSDNSQGALSTYDSAMCVDVSSESSAHKLDQCKGMLSESNKTIFEDIQNNHDNASYQEQEIQSDNSQETLCNYDSAMCVDVSSESSAHKLDQCMGMLSESNKAIVVNSKNIEGDQILQEQEIPSDNSQGTPTVYDSQRCVDVSTKSSVHKLDQSMGMLSESNKTIFEDIQKNQDDNNSDVQKLPYNNFQGSAANYDSQRCVDDQAKAFTFELDHSSVAVSERDVTIFNAVRDIRQDKEIVSSLGTILEVSEDGCTGVPKEVSVHKQNHVPADFGKKVTSASNYTVVTPENQEIPSGQPIVADHDEKNSAYVKEASPASKMSQSSGNVNKPVMERSEKNSSTSPSIFENCSDDDDDDDDDDDKDILNEVYQSCLAKGMRPKYLSKTYLKRLANACKTAAEIKARKPEPRVKLDKPCRLDTNLMYAVRQSLKRSLPLIAGKNKLSALMMMADGMFDEMSLDRGLDDLAWPFDPLAELRESGLAMVDYMEPHPSGSTSMNTSDMKDQSSPSEFVVPFASTQDENDQNSSDSVVKILDNIVKTKYPVPMYEQQSTADEDINPTEFHTEVSRPTGQPIATTATDDLSSPQCNSSEISLGTSVFREDLPEKLTENDSDTGHYFERYESSEFDNLMHNDDTSTWTLKREPVLLGQISPIDFQPPTSHSSDILETTSVDSDLQSEDSALGQENYSTSVDDTCSTSDFSSDIEEVDPSSQNLQQKIQFFSNATSTLFSKPSSASHVSFKVSVPSKVLHFEKLAQEERSGNPQKFLAKNNQLVSHSRLSSAGDAKIKIEKFERMRRVPTVPTVNIKHETLDGAIKEDTSASKVNVKNRVKMFEVSDGLTAFNTQPISEAKPKITGRLNKSKIAFFEHLANSNI